MSIPTSDNHMRVNIHKKSENNLIIYSNILAGEIKALRDVWLIGDNTIRELHPVLQQMESDAFHKRKRKPYLHELYNVKFWYPDIMNYERTAIARITNSLIQGLNTSAYLPRYLIVIPDRDIIDSTKFFNFGSGHIIEENIRWLIREVKRLLLARRENLKNVRPGALAPSMEPRIIWVAMSKRPIYEDERLKQIFVLRKKFNEILAMELFAERYMHIMYMTNLTPNFRNFDRQGNLTGEGKYQFWMNLDDQMKQFERQEIELRPTN